jgi:hypothetical protein
MELGISLLVIEGGVQWFKQVGFRSARRIKKLPIEWFQTQFHAICWSKAEMGLVSDDLMAAM